MKLAKMGIFIGLDREIKVLNYSCKPFLTIKTPEGDTLVREWCLSERLSGCLVHFVCPNGNIYALDVLAQD